jgi:hypothetical protein
MLVDRNSKVDMTVYYGTYVSAATVCSYKTHSVSIASASACAVSTRLLLVSLLLVLVSPLLRLL